MRALALNLMLVVKDRTWIHLLNRAIDDWAVINCPRKIGYALCLIVVMQSHYCFGEAGLLKSPKRETNENSQGLGDYIL